MIDTIFLDKVLVYVAHNMDKPRDFIESDLEFIIKQSILHYFVNDRKVDLKDLSDFTVTLVIDFCDDEINNKTKLVVEEYMFEISYLGEVALRTLKLGNDYEHYAREDVADLEKEIDLFLNGIGIPKEKNNIS
ncbi:hypothetical protein [Leptotrichia sp. oral taxon 218]|mgnify:FL=1|uniref:hypothetical protein n=1 Tax=Leptotrichia sp. oral taxon 218 TaxID=712361 RepID=UPI002012D504|nr:hypothetical protein [Leptotrichia sp. oral taxon 218]